MKMKVNDTCIGCGLCEMTCPDVFHLEDGIAHAIEGEIPADCEASALEALEGCPVGAIEQV